MGVCGGGEGTILELILELLEVEYSAQKHCSENDFQLNVS